jgi:hypothetical protein
MERRGNDATALLLAAARHLAPLDPALARMTYLEALGTAAFASWLGGSAGVREVAHAARAAPPAPRLRAIDLLLDGLTIRFTQGYAAAVLPLRRALAALSRADAADEGTQWVWLGCLVAADL